MAVSRQRREEIKREIDDLRKRLAVLEAELAGPEPEDRQPLDHMRLAGSEGEKVFAAVFRNTSVLLAVTRLKDGVILDVNRAFEKYYDMPREEILGHTTEGLGIWTSREQREELMGLLAEEGRFVEQELRVWTPAKGYRDLLWSGDVLEVMGEPCVISATLDITRRKRAERKLSESREKLQMALDGADLGTWETVYRDGASQRKTQFDRRAAEMLGFKPGEMKPESEWFIARIHPDDQAMVDRARREYREGRAARYEAEVRVRNKNNEYLWLLMRGKVVAREEQGQPTRILGTMLDVHERRENEERLKASEADLNKAQELAGMGSYQWEVSTGKLTWSRNMYVVAGIQPGEFGGTLDETMQALLPPGEYERTKVRVRSILEARKFIPSEFRIVRPDGEERIIQSDGILLLDAQGKPERVIGVNLDVTENRQAQEKQRRMEARMLEAQKLESLARLAGGVAHDFNNMLMGVLGYTGMARGALPPDSPVIEQLEQIESSAKRLRDLTGQLLAYAGQGRFFTRPVNLSALVGEQLDLLHAVISKDAALVQELADDLSAVEGDDAQIRQVVMNLVVNASDALSGRQGEIRVRTGMTSLEREFLDQAVLGERLSPGKFAFIEVRDNGSGMEPETRARIFDPFFTTRSKGRGLGLAATLGIVGGHNGAITVEGHPGEGSIVTVFLPCLDSAAPVRKATKPAPVRKKQTSTVLVVDDEEVVREVLKRQLIHAGCRVLTAVDGQEGVEVFQDKAGEIDLVILDKTMPRLDGLKALERIFKIEPEARVILMSGYTKESLDLPDPGSGRVAFLQKPFGSTRLLELMRRLID